MVTHTPFHTSLFALQFILQLFSSYIHIAMALLVFDSMDVSYFILPSPYRGIFNLLLFFFFFFAITNSVINHFTYVQVHHQEKFMEVEFPPWALYILIDHHRCPLVNNLTTHTPIQFGQQHGRGTSHPHQPFHL